MSEADLDSVSRTPKKNPRDVLVYEIDMLLHCFQNLSKQHADQHVSNLYIEGYLLHYRNLTEFFGAAKKDMRETDMSVRRDSEKWGKRTLSDTEVESITALGEPLHKAWKDHIGQQLHHCTAPRFESKRAWPIGEMHAALCKIISVFQLLDVL